MSDVHRQDTARLRIKTQSKKAVTSTQTNSSLTSPTTPTLAKPTRGFGIQADTALSEKVIQASSNLQQEAQSANQQFSEAGHQQLLAHDISRISLRPQARLNVNQSEGEEPQQLLMRQDVDAGVNATQTSEPTDAGPVAGVPTDTTTTTDTLSADLQDFINHGIYGPEALVPPTNIGGFDATYDPEISSLLIEVKTGVNFNNGLAIDDSNVITANHTDLNQAATDGMNLPPEERAAFVADFTWDSEQKEDFIDNLQFRVEDAWSSSGTGLSFVSTRPGWESVTATVSVDVNVHEGAAGDDDHLQTTVYKVPDGGTYNVGAFVDSDRNDPNKARDQDPHNNELVMSSTDVNETPESHSLLQKTVQFENNSSALTPDAQSTLQAFAIDFQDANLDLTNPVELVGHASSTGTDEHNEQLAQARINEVRKFLASVGFTGINERVSTQNMGEIDATEDPEWRRVDLIVGSGEGQLVAAHEFGHVFGLDDEYVSNDVNPGGSITGSGKAVGTAVGHDDMARAIGTTGAIAENNDGIMSLGNTIRPQHYATFGWALGKVTGVTEWRAT